MKNPTQHTLQTHIATSDIEWKYEISDSSNPQICGQAGIIKSLRVVSSPKSQGIFLQWIAAPLNRATQCHPLEDLVLVSFNDFRPTTTEDDESRPATHKHAVKYVERFLGTGLILNGILYSFYGHSNSQLKSRSCYLLAGSKECVSGKVESLGDFKKIKTVAKKAKRVGLMFSTAERVLDVPAERCQDIDDVERDGFIFTDGCGLISKNLVHTLARKKPIIFHDRRYYPSVLQIRYRGYKGVVTIDPQMQPGIWLRLRKSMKKFSGTNDISFAVVGHSKPYVYGYLNDEIVLLLHSLGITSTVFSKKQAEYFEFLETCRTDPHSAFRLLSSLGMIIEAEKLLVEGSEVVNKTVRKVISQEYGNMVKEGWDGEKVQKARILIPKSRLLFGICDPFGILNPDECFLRVTLDEFGALKTITGANVLISRNPTLHPGDLRKLKAIDYPKLHHLTDCVVFSTRGKRPTADLMSGGDLDGDTFFVCWDSDLIPQTMSEPAEYPGAKEASRFSPIKSEDLIAYFAGYNNMSLGRVKKLFLGWARALGPHCSQCQELNRLYSQCVDGNRIKIPDSLCDPPQPSPDAEPFILDVLHDLAAVHWVAVKTNVTCIDFLDRETLVNILSSPNPLSEFELAKMTFAWCRINRVPFEEFWTFFAAANLTSDEQAWLLSELPTTVQYAASIKNGLHQSNILTRQDLEVFRLDYHALHWKCAFDSASDPLRSLMTAVNGTFQYFAKKLLVLHMNERLSVAVYFPGPLKRGEDVLVDSSVRLFAFPHTHKDKSGHRRVVPTKQNYRFYYDETVMQLYENQRSNTFLFFTHSAGDNTSYGDLVGKSNQSRARQQLIDDGITCDWRVSIALQKFSAQLATQIGRTNRAPVTAAELYVISNKDVQALRALDLWLESVDTLEVLPNFPDEKPEYRLATVSDINWKQHGGLLSQVVRDREFHRLIEASTVQIVELLQFCWQYNLSDIILEVYGRLLKLVGEPPLPRCRAETANELIEFLHYRPTLAIHFARFCPWNRLPDEFAQQLQLRAFGLLRAMLLSANKMGLLVVHHLKAILQENVSLSLMAAKDLLETATLVVKSPELLHTISMECQDVLSKTIQDLDDESISYFLRNMYGIALDHSEEADETQGVTPGFWTLKPQEGITGKTLLITSRRRVDAPKLSRLAVGDHVRFIASKEPVNSIALEATSFDALVDAVSDNVVNFRCFCQPPSFIQEASWSLKHYGSFVTSQATAEALVQLLLEQDQCCGVYKSLRFSKAAFSVQSTASDPTSNEEMIDGLNASQSRAVTVSLNERMTCLWGPPGTGKTTTIVALLRSALERDMQERVLVAAPTHNAVDNVLRQYIRKALGKDSSLPQPVRVSTEFSRVADDLKDYTCDAMFGKDLNQHPFAKRKSTKRIAESRLVFTTCVGAALGLLRTQTFGTVIIDEASQQTEPASLIPLVKGCQRAVLVGDHVQLRATVRKYASTLDFDVSLMERLWTGAATSPNTSIGRVMLDTQYRMHPDICRFPSSEFYQSQLLTATGCRGIGIPPSRFPWPAPMHTAQAASAANSRCVFVQCSEPEDYGRKSKVNQGQTRVCKDVLALLYTTAAAQAKDGEAPNEPRASPPTLAILTPYSRQADLLRETCPGALVSSIDGFQGQEADIIVFVTVRCNLRGEIGFLNDMRRLNVALTRAKAGVIIIGDQATLSKGKEDEDACRVWDRLINVCTKVVLPTNVLHSAYQVLTRRPEALRLTEQVVEARKRTLGEEHPDTLSSIHALAVLCSEASQWPEALRLMEQVVEARKRTLGEEHLDTLSSIYALAVLYSETGRWPEALRLKEQVVEARKRTLGEEHPDTLASVNPVNDEGFTALYYAAEMRRLESVRVLLARDDVDRTIRLQESMARILMVPNGP